MVNNQTEFNNKYNNKEVKEIKIKDEDFQGQLIIENYSKLEKLYLHDVDSIDKVTLKNLTQLQEFTIWDCEMKELVIENCPLVKKINIRKNLLTSLKFLASLENLEALELDGNPELIEILKSYNGDWKIYRKNIQELIKLVKENPQKLLDMQEENKELKVKYGVLKKVLASFSKETQEQIKEKEIEEIRRKMKNTTGPLGKETEEILVKFGVSVEKLKKFKEEKQKELIELKEQKQELEVGLIKEKKEQLEKLKNDFSTKRAGYTGKKEKVRDSLEAYLTSVKEQTLNPNSPSVLTLKEKEKNYLLKKNPEGFTELLNKLTEKLQEISLLEVGVSEEQLSQTQIVMARVRKESTSKKTLEYKDDSSKTQVGFQFDVSTKTFNFGVNREKKDVTLNIYESQSETIEATKIGQRIIEKEFGIGGQFLLPEIEGQTQNRLKRQSSPVETQNEGKVPKLERQVESMEIDDYDWKNIRPSFTNELIQSWQRLHFTYRQTRDWINVGLEPTDAFFCAWLRDTKHLVPEQVLNHYNLEQLNQEFFYLRKQQQARIQQPPK